MISLVEALLNVANVVLGVVSVFDSLGALSGLGRLVSVVAVLASSCGICRSSRSSWTSRTWWTSSWSPCGFEAGMCLLLYYYNYILSLINIYTSPSYSGDVN